MKKSQKGKKSKEKTKKAIELIFQDDNEEKLKKKQVNDYGDEYSATSFPMKKGFSVPLPNAMSKKYRKKEDD